MWVQSLGWEDPLAEGMAAHSSNLAGESHGQRSLVRLLHGLETNLATSLQTPQEA